MKLFQSFFAAFTFQALFLPGLAGMQATDAIMPAIKLAEGVKDPAKRGPAGELGWYRVTPAVWMQYCTDPFELCGTDAAFEERVVRVHLQWIHDHLKHPTIYQMAEAWNAGLTAVKKDQVPASAKDYARRVVNLVGVYSH